MTVRYTNGEIIGLSTAGTVLAWSEALGMATDTGVSIEDYKSWRAMSWAERARVVDARHNFYVDGARGE